MSKPRRLRRRLRSAASDLIVLAGICLILGVLATIDWRISVGLAGALLVGVGHGWS